MDFLFFPLSRERLVCFPWDGCFYMCYPVFLRFSTYNADFPAVQQVDGTRARREGGGFVFTRIGGLGRAS
jgi:hypothetical protein